MQIQATEQGDILYLKLLVKRIDASFASEFKAFVLGRINSGKKKILLNLSEVDFIDSSGLGAIVAILKALGGRSNLAICGLRETVSTLFRLSHMDKIFQTFVTEEDAQKVLDIKS
jgi:anti-sigma B factor antagonist